MSKVDTRKITKTSLNQQEWALDVMPSKKTKKAKAKERQAAKKIINEELSDDCPHDQPFHMKAP